MDDISFSRLFEIIGLVVAGILPIANPLSTAPIFAAMTSEMSDSEKAALARRVFLYFVVTLFVALLTGLVVLEFFGISIAGLQTAGGLVILYIGFRMLFPQPAAAVGKDLDGQGDPAFVPLTMPMLSGPGAISVVIGMASRIEEQQEMIMQVLGYVLVTVGIVFCGALCWMTLRASGWLVSHMGPQAVDAVTRLMGFLLICVAVEFLRNGIFGFIADLQAI